MLKHNNNKIFTLFWDQSCHGSTANNTETTYHGSHYQPSKLLNNVNPCPALKKICDYIIYLGFSCYLIIPYCINWRCYTALNEKWQLDYRQADKNGKCCSLIYGTLKTNAKIRICIRSFRILSLSVYLTMYHKPNYLHGIMCIKYDKDRMVLKWK